MIVVVEDMVAEGDKVAARCSVRGKHEGDFLEKSRNSISGRVYRHDNCADRTMERLLRPGITSTS